MSYKIQTPPVDVFDLLETAPLPTFIIDAQSFRICKASASASNFYQYTKEELTQLSFLHLQSEKDKVALVDKLTANKAFTLLVEQQKKDSTVCSVELVAAILTTDITTFYQITTIDRTELVHKANQYKHYIEESSEAVWRYELSEPVSIKLSPKQIIAHIQKHAFLAECNNQFAVMNGFTSSADLLATPLEKVFDFTDPENVQFLKTFIEYGYRWMDAERKFVDPVGNCFYFSSNMIGIVENGFLKGAWVTQQDISEKKKIELALRESEHRFRELADSAPALIWICDEYNKITYVNRSWVEFTGLDLTGKGTEEWASIIHPEDKEKTIEACRTASNQKQPITVTYRLLDQKGDYKWVVDTSTPRFTKNGTFVGYIGSLIDITEQKEREEQLRYQSMLFENVSDIIVTTDLNFIIKSWNKVAAQYYELEEHEAIGKKMCSLLAFEYSNTTQKAALQELLSRGIWRGEITIVNKNNEKKYLQQTVAFVHDKEGKKIGVMAVGRDITHDKKTELKLEKSELFYKSLIKDSSDGMILVDTTSTITFVSPSIKKILGYDVEDVLGKTAFEFIHMEDIPWAAKSLQKEIDQNPEVKSISIRLKRKDGTWLWCMVRGYNLLSNPYVNGVVIYFHDDTLRKKAREELKASEERFRHLISELQVGVLMQDTNSRVILCNKMAQDILGVPEVRLLEMTPADYLHDVIHEDGTKYKPEEFATLTAVRTKRAVRDKVMGIWRPITNDRIWILLNAEPILNKEGEVQHVICSFADITERKKLEQKLIADEINHQRLLTQATIDGQEQERKEIGKELHDNIGQQLTTTKLYLDLAKSTADDSTNELISLALKRVSDVINEIRSISHSLVPLFLGDLGLCESLKELTDSIRRTQLIKVHLDTYNIKEKDIADNKKLMIYRIVQEQLNNIVKHANASDIYVNVFDDDDHLLIEVKDNGNGFDLNNVKKGLGLKNIQNRAALFGGKATITSAPGKGCTLKVVLPHHVDTV